MSADDLRKLKIEKKNFGARPQNARKWLILGGVVILIFAVVLIVLNKPLSVQTATVSQTFPSQNVTILNASGYVVAQRKAAVSAKVTSRLEWLGVEEGSNVKTGQIVARLEREDVLANRDQAQGNLHAARAVLEQTRAEFDDATLSYSRLRDLYGQGVVSKADFDSAEARLRRARAGVRSAESTISALSATLRGAENAIEYTTVRAPFDGVVLTKNADVGDIVTPIGAAANAKAAVVTIADLSSLQVEADVSEVNLSKIKVGQPCEIQLDALPDKRFHGIVYTIVPTADRTKATVLVKVRFLEKDPALLPEMSAKVAFLERAVTKDEAKPMTTAPVNAVSSSPAGSFIYVVKDGFAVRTQVRTGRKFGDQVEVLAGVKPGEKVVISPLSTMKERNKVTLSEK